MTNERNPYEKTTANQLVEMAEAYFKWSGDRKCFISPNEFRTLIDAKREVDSEYDPERLNRPQIGGNYLHQIVFEGLPFISVTEEPLDLKS